MFQIFLDIPFCYILLLIFTYLLQFLLQLFLPFLHFLPVECKDKDHQDQHQQRRKIPRTQAPEAVRKHIFNLVSPPFC